MEELFYFVINNTCFSDWEVIVKDQCLDSKRSLSIGNLNSFEIIGSNEDQKENCFIAN